MNRKMNLRVGDLVEVRSKEEILRTLDQKGQLENLPFMPQMFKYCGMQFRVFKRAHKTCDTVNEPAGLKMSNAVHLEGIRCDGESYGGCQAACLIFWKEDWLKKVGAEPSTPPSSTGGSGCTERDVTAATVRRQEGDDKIYSCQATQLPFATRPLPWCDLRQYAEDVASGNASAWSLFRGAVYFGYFRLVQSGLGLGPFLRWLYNRIQALWKGVPFPRKSGRIPSGQPTPVCELGLEPGELVRVKSHEEILATLDRSNRNRGLFFDVEAVPYCGGTYRVRGRVQKIINEKTGRLQHMKTPSVILEGVCCQGRYSSHRLLCPRSIYSFWREVWLERVEEKTSGRNPALVPETEMAHSDADQDSVELITR